MVDGYEEKLREKEKNITYLEGLNADQLANSSKEVDGLRKLVEN